MSDMSAQLNCERFGIAALEAAHAIVRQPTPLLRKLRRSVRRIRAYRQMVSVASTQRSSTKNRSHPAAALCQFSCQRLDIPDARPCVGTTAQGFCDTDRLWRPDGGWARSHCLVARSVGENSSHSISLALQYRRASRLGLREYLGVSYYLAAINVPAMVVVHVLIFAYLFTRNRDLPMSATKIKENRLGYEP